MCKFIIKTTIVYKNLQLTIIYYTVNSHKHHFEITYKVFLSLKNLMFKDYYDFVLKIC